MKLRTQFILLLLPLIAAPVAVLGYLAQSEAQQSRQSAAEQLGALLLDRLDSRLQTLLQAPLSLVSLLAREPSIVGPLVAETPAAATDRWTRALDALPDIRAIHIPHPESPVSFPRDLSNGARATERCEFLMALIINDFRSSSVSLHPCADGVNTQSVAASIASAPQSSMASLGSPLAVAVSLRALTQEVVRINAEYPGDISLWWAPEDRWWPSAGTSVDAPDVDAALALSGGFHQVRRPSGESDLLSARYIGDGLVAVYRISGQQAVAPALRGHTVFLILLLTAVAVLLGLLAVSGRLVHPLGRLRSAVSTIGDEQMRVTISHHSADEVGQLATAVQDMGNRVFDAQRANAETIDRLRLANQTLEQARVAAQTASMAKSEFLARFSREIRTPMNDVLGMAELLQATPLTEQQQRHADTIQRSGIALLDILSEVIDFSRIEAGELALERTDFSLEDLVAQCVNQQMAAARAKDLQLGFDLSLNQSRRVAGDPHRLAQILNHLIINAIRYTDRGHIRVRVRQDDWDDDGIWTRFAVEDSGIGISNRNLSRVFDGLAPEPGAGIAGDDGSGLGLTICKQLVELMGGSISVDSAIGAGSIFRFCIPLHAPCRTEPIATAQVPDGAQPIQACVLVVEDNPTNLEVAKGMLESLHCETQEAAHGLAAVHRVRRGGVDLILMDCQMPVMDGFAATEAIRSWEAETPGQDRLPIIALTANALDGDRERCLQAGMDDYLTKPLTLEQLHQKLDHWLNHHRQAEAAAAES